MAENYCGRSCEGCELQTELNCKGCKNGPGGELRACELATCCESKMLISCNDCSVKDECAKVQSHKSTPDYIRNSLSAEISKIKRIKEQAKFAGEFKKLFLLGIISIVAGFLSNETISVANPVLGAIGSIATIVCSVMLIITFFKLGNLIEEYKISAYCRIASIVVAIIVLIISVISIFTISSVGTVFSVILMLVTAGITLFGTYKEYQGHFEILSGIDDEFAEKWDVLWNIFIFSFGGMIVGLVLMFISVLLAGIIILAGAIALVVEEILKLKYIKKMHDLFESLEFKYKNVLFED